MKFRKAIVSLALASLTTAGMAQTPPQSASEPQQQVAKAKTSAKAAQSATRTSGIDITAINKSVRPQDDFFGFVNGAWLEKIEIPADQSRYGAFNILSDDTQEQLKAIIFAAAKKKAAPGSNEQKLGDMYASFTNEALIEELSWKPIAADLKAIQAISDHTQVAQTMGHLVRLGVSAPLGFYVYPDARQPGIYGFWLAQDGLTLPDRDYYLSDDAKYKTIRADLQSYAADLLTLVDYPEAQTAAQNIVALETAIAKIQNSKVESRDAEKNYNKRSAAEVDALLGDFDWSAYSQAAGAEHVSDAIVRNYPYFEEFGELFQSTPPQVWKDYLTFHLVDQFAPDLSAPFVDRRFAFRGTTLNGVPQNEPRWKRGVAATSGALGEVLGQEYVARHFSPEAKARMQVLVTNLIAAYGESIQELPWMSAETKTKALQKLASFRPKIGYPDKWRDYSALTIAADDFVGNVKRSTQFELDYDLTRAGKAVDPADWSMTPQTVNAYYSPTRNEIVFPAAILQPPFFNLNADDAVNYGGIGGVIGHEIGHGFDDQGSKYDGGGNLSDWWTAQDRAAFDALGDRLVAQYDAFTPLDGMNVNGRLTLGENIGDLAGVAIGYRAYLRSLDGKDAPVIDGFTGPQRFFMGWAQVWRSKIREDALRARLLSDPHSPAEYRVLGPLRQVNAFYDAFGVAEGDKMYIAPSDRVVIW